MGEEGEGEWKDGFQDLVALMGHEFWRQDLLSCPEFTASQFSSVLGTPSPPLPPFFIDDINQIFIMDVLGQLAQSMAEAGVAGRSHAKVHLTGIHLQGLKATQSDIIVHELRPLMDASSLADMTIMAERARRVRLQIQ